MHSSENNCLQITQLCWEWLAMEHLSLDFSANTAEYIPCHQANGHTFFRFFLLFLRTIQSGELLTNRNITTPNTHIHRTYTTPWNQKHTGMYSAKQALHFTNPFRCPQLTRKHVFLQHAKWLPPSFSSEWQMEVSLHHLGLSVLLHRIRPIPLHTHKL